MKLLVLLVVCSMALAEPDINPGCTSNTEIQAKGIEECNETEYTSYVECMRRRMKRSTDCNQATPNKPCTDCEETSCEQCDCDFCSVNTCDSNCDSCCPNNPPCQNNRCCHKTCHSRCKSINCRSECRRNCKEKVTITSGNATIVADSPRHNITTIIDIHNIINNTNEIEIPVQINNTNHNNFTLGGSSDPTQIQIADNVETNVESCCQILSQRQCVPKQEYPFVRCFQMRKKACGSICQAPVLLEQSREICEQVENGTKCHQEVVYVPQYQQNCNFQPFWPYISCGTQQYNPYGPPAPLQQPATGCPGCYGDMGGWNSQYRPIPFYGQGYAPPQSVFQSGSYYPYSYGTPSLPYTPPYNNFIGAPAGGYPFYPTINYDNSIHIPSSPSNVGIAPNDSNSYVNKKEITLNPQPIPWNQYQYQYQYQPQPQPLPPWQFYYPVQTTPLGYPYQSPNPLYYLPPEVNIQATVSQPEKSGRYAQITITDKREADADKGIYETVTDNTSKDSEGTAFSS